MVYCWVIAAKVTAARVLVLSEEVILGINLHNGRELNKALVGVGSLNS